jgi:phi13 family phage major tail protein
MAKIKYGLRNVYYAKATDDGTGNLTYATPVRIAGAVNMSLDAQGDTTPFYADDIVYFSSTANNGYSGTLEVALIPDSFRKDILGETEGTQDNVLYEYANAPTVEFALLFEFQTDENATKHCMYRCTASRASVAGQTKEDSITPQTETLNIVAMPRVDDYLVKAKCPSTSSAYANWYTAVHEPTA